MTAKQYLQSYQRLAKRYMAIAEEIKNLESDMISLKSPCLEPRVQTSPKKDPIGEMVCNLEKEKGRLAIKMTESWGKMSLIKQQIYTLNETDEDFYMVLLFRYILNKDWKYICDKLLVSRAHANVIHSRALQEFDRKFSDFYGKI